MMSDEQMKNKLRCHGRFPNVALFGNPNFGNIKVVWKDCPIIPAAV